MGRGRSCSREGMVLEACIGLGPNSASAGKGIESVGSLGLQAGVAPAPRGLTGGLTGVLTGRLTGGLAGGLAKDSEAFKPSGCCCVGMLMSVGSCNQQQ